jgi:magnesium transporter
MTAVRKTDTAQRMARHLIDYAPGTAASEIESIPEREAAKFLAAIPAAAAAAVTARLTPVKAQQLLEQIPLEAAAKIFSKLDLSKAAALIARFSAQLQGELLAHMDAKIAAEINALSRFPEGTAGSMMDPAVLAFHPDMKTREVLKQVRNFRRKIGRDIFLIDEDGVLCGAVPLQALALADSGQRLEELKGFPPLEVLGVASSNEVIDSLSQTENASVVVVDVDRHLLGVILRDTLIQAAQETASADLQSMVGAGKEERALSPALYAVRKRLPWLIVNLGTAFLAASVVGIFESTIAKFTALAVLLPVVAGQSGNTGAQALAVTMRGLALREVRLSQGFGICFKELRAGMLNGIAVAIITSGAVFVWSRSLGLSLVILLSMVISMMAAGLSGSIIPMLLTALKQDPAQSSSIVLTTVTDVVGFFSFLGIATLLSTMI